MRNIVLSSLLTLPMPQEAERGFRLRQKDGKRYLQVFAGMKPSGGYSISVSRMEEVEGRLQVTVTESVPQKGDIVTFALTHPQTTVLFDSPLDTIVVVDEAGTSYPEK